MTFKQTVSKEKDAVCFLLHIFSKICNNFRRVSDINHGKTMVFIVKLNIKEISLIANIYKGLMF